MDAEKIPPSGNTKEQWKIPYKIIAFIENRIMELEENRSIVQEFDIMQWHGFKEVLFDIYDHRIRYAPELNGGANTTYCTLSEHIITFFIDQYPKRKKAEEKIVDLLINLRYYYDIWNRAKLFAWNCELIQLPQ